MRAAVSVSEGADCPVFALRPRRLRARARGSERKIGHTELPLPTVPARGAGATGENSLGALRPAAAFRAWLEPK